MNYKYKTVLVTGGSSGIGESVLKEFADKKPKRLFSFDINEPKERIPNVNYIQVDVSNGYDLSKAMSNIPDDSCNDIDFVVNCAGVMEEETPEGIEKMFKVNAKGTSNLLHNLTNRFSQGAVFVQVSSAMALNLKECIGYSGSKLAGALIAKSYGECTLRNHSTVKIVYPGPVDTPLFRKGKTEERIQRIKPTKPEELAEKIIALIESDKKVLRCLDDFPNWTYVLE